MDGKWHWSLEIPAPHRQIAQQMDVVLHPSGDQVRAWLRRMRETIPGFEYTGSQIEWKRLLETAGLDPWLVDTRRVDTCSAAIAF